MKTKNLKIVPLASAYIRPEITVGSFKGLTLKAVKKPVGRGATTILGSLGDAEVQILIKAKFQDALKALGLALSQDGKDLIPASEAAPQTQAQVSDKPVPVKKAAPAKAAPKAAPPKKGAKAAA